MFLDVRFLYSTSVVLRPFRVVTSVIHVPSPVPLPPSSSACTTCTVVETARHYSFYEVAAAVLVEYDVDEDDDDV